MILRFLASCSCKKSPRCQVIIANPEGVPKNALCDDCTSGNCQHRKILSQGAFMIIPVTLNDKKEQDNV